jgi:hypothetical protein
MVYKSLSLSSDRRRDLNSYKLTTNEDRKIKTEKKIKIVRKTKNRNVLNFIVFTWNVQNIIFFSYTHKFIHVYVMKYNKNYSFIIYLIFKSSSTIQYELQHASTCLQI